jgi:hypothetical protein
MTKIKQKGRCTAHGHIFPLAKSVAHHSGTQEIQDLANGVGKSNRVIACIKQTNRARIGGEVLNQQRSGIPRPDESVGGICDDNLPGESFAIRAAVTFPCKSYSHCCVQPGNMAARQARGASALLYMLIQCGRNDVARNRSDPKDSAIRADHAADDSCDGAIGVAMRQRASFHKRAYCLGEISITALIHEARLSDGITRLRDSVIATRNNVSFEHVTRAQNVLRVSDSHERSQGPGATVSVHKIIGPAARGPQPNWWRLSLRVAHGVNLIHQFDLHGCPSNLLWEIVNRVGSPGSVSIDKDLQRRVVSLIEADRGSQDLWLFHQSRCDFFLNGHHPSNTGMCLIQNLGLKAGQTAVCEASQRKAREKRGQRQNSSVKQ